MENKPVFYDGSIEHNSGLNEQSAEDYFQLTDEMRATISGNPYHAENK